ncbi:MAG: hypothetical protein U1C74_27670, partial [Phenylobacterium sp.]|nr:hypothetical protein [Phenylobacterium sp.]
CGDGGEAMAQRDAGPAFEGVVQPVSQAGPPQALQQAPQGGAPPMPQGGQPQGGPPQASETQAQQALRGLYGIRQQQCQMGNTLACQALGEFPRHSQDLAQAAQACRAGGPPACGTFNALSQRIFTSYAESAQVMQAGAQSAAQMEAWRAQMNANHAGNMARLNAQAAAGQAAHEARQESYAAQNQAWANGQAAAERNTGRFNDYIYEGTTVNGGGVQTRIPYGSAGYTDRQGNVIAVPDGAPAPDGWQKMNPTYAAPR